LALVEKLFCNILFSLFALINKKERKEGKGKIDVKLECLQCEARRRGFKSWLKKKKKKERKKEKSIYLESNMKM
jgi:hypothetical protein